MQKLYNGKYIIDAGAIFLSTETGFLGFGAKFRTDNCIQVKLDLPNTASWKGNHS